MAIYEQDPALEEHVLLKMVAPYVDRVAKKVADEARRLAPPTKIWLVDPAARHRPTHTEHSKIQGQIRPDNLRFAAESMRWDMEDPEGPHLGPTTYFLQPRDQSSAAVAGLKHCRCAILHNPQGIRQYIKTDPPILSRKTYSVTVVCQGPHVIEAELGDHYQSGAWAASAEGTRFMARAVWAFAAR